MQVRFKCAVAGETENFRAGDVVDLPKATADEYIRYGWCVDADAAQAQRRETLTRGADEGHSGRKGRGK